MLHNRSKSATTKKAQKTANRTLTTKKPLKSKKSTRGTAKRTVQTSCATEVESAGFPGSPAPYTTELGLTSPAPLIPVFRITDTQGQLLDPNYKIKHSDETLTSMYKHMLKLNNLDKVFYDAQRQGRISFYMTSFGEEATHIGAAAALDKNDTIFAQYRESGVLLWRGFTLPQMAHQCFGTLEDLGKGRQMPVHYGSRELNFQTISSPLATQLPQAVGHAYALKNAGQKNIVACFFGEGAASEGDFHAALNFSATLEAPVMFFCRNNGYAISTPVKDQYRGDGIAGRASGYGIKTIRVDGNDLLAVYDATNLARDYIMENQKPCVVETYSYRAGHHSTSDDSTRYRDVEEINQWQTTNNPITRFRNFLTTKGLWNDDMEKAENDSAREQVLSALTEAEVAKKPAVSQLFQDVYDKLPKHLVEQEQEWNQHMAKYGEHYGLDEFVPNDQYQDPGKM